MRFSSQDPDIETIVRRIEDGDYDLQPDFQRGEVWSTQKKRRLIDSVLRGWHIPPVHLVAGSDGRSDVLDGQQRLTAIRDFVRGKFSVDGSIEPVSTEIAALGGLRYAELPPGASRQFRKFTIRVFELVDFAPDEPHELFFRLNQPTSLTEAEKRNAFVGDARNQVRELSRWAVNSGLLGTQVGFSNARMAYDDVIARVLVTAEAQNLAEKITAARVTARYREKVGFSDEALDCVRTSLRLVSRALDTETNLDRLRPNKATLQTWLTIGTQLAMTAASESELEAFAKTLQRIEEQRWSHSSLNEARESHALEIFQNRSTARVADVSSVILRDLVAWMLLSQEMAPEPQSKARVARMAWEAAFPQEDHEDQLLSYAAKVEWGSLGWR